MTVRLLLIGLLLSTVGAAAEETPADSTCFERAAEQLETGERISVIRTDRARITGKLISVNPTLELLTLGRLDSAGMREFSFERGDLLEIRYRRPGTIRPAYPIFGFIAGNIIGMLVENHIIDPGYNYGLFESNYTSRGSFWGGLAGLASGAVLSMLIPSNRTLECN